VTGQRQYQVFFSYSQSNENPYLAQFRKDLSEMVSTRCALDLEDVLFVDREVLRTGAHWETNIRDALQSTRVLVALWSPHYFRSEWCGREWYVFWQRQLAHAAASGQPQKLPEVVIPVLWIPTSMADQPPASYLQNRAGSAGQTYAKQGLEHLLRRPQQFSVDYQNVLEALVTAIQQALDDRSVLPVAVGLPPGAGLPTMWSVAAQPAVAGSATPAAGPLQTPDVRFYFVAANADEIRTVRSADATRYYGERGGRDWRPYVPDPDLELGWFVQGALQREKVYARPVPLTKTAAAELADAQEQGELLIVMVDPWSARLPKYQALLSDFDKQASNYSAVLVPWNAQDAETIAHQQTLEDDLLLVLPTKAPVGSEQFRQVGRSAEQLANDLANAVALLSGRLMKVEQARRRLPPSPDPGVGRNMMPPSAGG
jgi:FxsC-like protein